VILRSSRSLGRGKAPNALKGKRGRERKRIRIRRTFGAMLLSTQTDRSIHIFI
jgi:hypothetical protein